MVIYSLLEVGKFLGGQGVRLANDGDDVDSGAEALHQLKVDFSEADIQRSNTKETDANAKGSRSKNKDQAVSEEIQKRNPESTFFCTIE